MSDDSVHTTQLHHWLQRMRAGDRGARDELIASVCKQLEALARRMLARFPKMHTYVDTEDVLNESVLRLLRSLKDVEPKSMRAFYGLAAQQMRRELIDLSRKVYGPANRGSHKHISLDAHDSQAGAIEPAQPEEDTDEVERWRRFHEAVEELPTNEHEVVSLVFYHEWTQAEVADLFQVDTRTVRRWWQSAIQKLRDEFRDELPAP